MSPERFTLENMFAMELHKYQDVAEEIVNHAIKVSYNNYKQSLVSLGWGWDLVRFWSIVEVEGRLEFHSDLY